MLPQSYVISDLNGEPVTGNFYEKKLHKTSQEKFMEWKRYDDSFNN